MRVWRRICDLSRYRIAELIAGKANPFPLTAPACLLKHADGQKDHFSAFIQWRSYRAFVVFRMTAVQPFNRICL